MAGEADAVAADKVNGTRFLVNCKRVGYCGEGGFMVKYSHKILCGGH